MRRPKHKKKKIGVIAIVLAVLLAFTLAVTAVLGIIDNGGSEEESLETVRSEHKMETDGDVKAAAEESSEKAGGETDAEQVISTPYMDFTCPKWIMDSIAIAEASEDGVYRLDLTGLVAEQEVELFSLLFAKESSEGYLVGVLETEDEGSVEVRIVIEPLEYTSSWNEEQANEVSMLQEYVNDVIDQLNENSNFTPAEE